MASDLKENKTNNKKGVSFTADSLQLSNCSKVPASCP